MYRINSGFVSHLINTLNSEGVDTHKLCQDVGINREQLRHPEGYINRTQVYQLMALAENSSGNPDIGLHSYQYFLPGVFQIVGYTMMSSPNLQTALTALARYLPLLGSGVKVELRDESDGMRLWIIETHEDISKPRSIDDAAVASLFAFCRWLTGEGLPCTWAVGFTYSQPKNTIEHQRLFGTNLSFGDPHINIYFDREALLRPLSTANEALALLHSRLAENNLDSLRQANLSARTRAWLIENISHFNHDMTSVAVAMNISPRTMRRGLALEGTSFSDLLNEVRKYLADYHLRNSSCSLLQISSLLGFTEVSSFSKACLRWFDMPPGKYRMQAAQKRGNGFN